MKNIEIIKSNTLFNAINDSDLAKMLSCLSAKTVFHKQKTFIIHTGEKIFNIWILLSGKAVVVKEDENGNRNIISEIVPGEMFGEAFACAGSVKSTVSVQAAEDSEVLVIDCKKIISTCSSACGFHNKLIENMLAILSSKIILLNQKIDFISKRTIREKLFAFFDMQKKSANSNKFTIPYNREELADFLSADRSAMSRELCRMRDEGLIKFNKNKFEIIDIINAIKE